ncbi:TPA: SGNH/GDSL hydrolase family protein [Burkholderia dolosa]
MGLSSSGSGIPVIVKPASASLQDALQKQFNDTGIRVANHATGGTSASLMNLLDGMDGGGAPFAERLAATQSTIVLISYGLNEQYGGETVSDFSGYLERAIQTVRDAGRRPVLETPSPTCDSDHPFTSSYAAAIKAVGVTYNVPVVDNYAAISAMPDWRAHMDGSCTLPDETLMTVMASQELAVIEPLVAADVGK